MENAEILLALGYENQGLVGQGAFSRVYRVREKETGIVFACKISGEQEMLTREAYFLKQTDHPLFPKFHEIAYRNGKGLLFLEYVRGVSLNVLVARRGKLSERQIVRIGAALAEGLCYLHERQNPVLFRDVKPENIIIKQDGGVKLLDLGSVGELYGGRKVITGTPGYAAPEQMEEGEAGFYSDVYAVGRVMYFMGTGKKTYSENTSNIWEGVKLHRGVKHLIEDCIRRDACERIPDMRYLLRRLKPYAEGQKWKIWRLEKNVWFRGDIITEYTFQQNIHKNTGKIV